MQEKYPLKLEYNYGSMHLMNKELKQKVVSEEENPCEGSARNRMICLRISIVGAREKDRYDNAIVFVHC